MKKPMAPFQYALLRYQHNLSAGELVNVGLVAWSPFGSCLLYDVPLRHQRLSSFFADFDGDGFKQNLGTIRSLIAKKSKELGDYGDLLTQQRPQNSLEEILHSIIPGDHNCFSWSSLRAGLTRDLSLRIKQLAEEYLDRHEHRSARERRDDKAVERALSKAIRVAGLSRDVQPIEIKGGELNHEFKFSWRNGRQNVLEPISLDYKNAKDMTNRANTAIGKLFDLAKSQEEVKVFSVVTPPPRSESAAIRDQFNKACKMLKSAPGVADVITEDQVEGLLEHITQDLQNH